MDCSSQIRSVGELCYPWLLSVWVKTPMLRNSGILSSSACLPLADPIIFEDLSKGMVTLLVCPERENPAFMGR
ncbi:MAG: hypothetical protein NZ955_07405 [Candidatus Bathyarchaeota archaeon]|nr:hypothetical protein [Candidatus Bathyarchaeota archaeon]